MYIVYPSFFWSSLGSQVTPIPRSAFLSIPGVIFVSYSSFMLELMATFEKRAQSESHDHHAHHNHHLGHHYFGRGDMCARVTVECLMTYMSRRTKPIASCSRTERGVSLEISHSFPWSTSTAIDSTGFLRGLEWSKLLSKANLLQSRHSNQVTSARPSSPYSCWPFLSNCEWW